MKVERNSTATSNLQINYNVRQTQEITSKGHTNHNMSKMSSMNNKEEMKSNCSMKGIHDQSVSTKSRALVDSKLGAKLDIRA